MAPFKTLLLLTMAAFLCAAMGDIDHEGDDSNDDTDIGVSHIGE